MIKIEPIKKEEIKEVIEFHNKYLGSRPFITQKEIQKRIDTNTGIFLTAKDNNKIVGIKLGYIDKDICIGRGIAVDQEYRRMGVGTMLVTEFEKRVKQYPYIKKYIFASSSLEGVPFHIKMGYKPSLLIQSPNKSDIDKISSMEFNIQKRMYNKEFNVYQLYIKEDNLNLNRLNKLKNTYPNLDIQYLFSKDFN